MNQHETNDTLIEEIVQLLLREKENAFPKILTKIYNEAMLVERAAHLGAGKYERAEEREDYANGIKPRTLQTRVGKLSLQVPQVRCKTISPRALRSSISRNTCERSFEQTTSRKG